MKVEINPEETSRAAAFDLWMKSPMPMVTLVKTMDVSSLYRLCQKKKLSFTMLMCWCVGKAVTQIDEFMTLPEQGKLFRYDSLAINTIVVNKNGGINSCDVPFSFDFQRFKEEYQSLTAQTISNCKSIFMNDTMIVGTSAIIQTELDCIVNQYSDIFSNPMVMWGKFHKSLFKTTLPVSFQFHHVQMDGQQGAQFLNLLQQTISNVQSLIR